MLPNQKKVRLSPVSSWLVNPTLGHRAIGIGQVTHGILRPHPSSGIS